MDLSALVELRRQVGFRDQEGPARRCGPPPRRPPAVRFARGPRCQQHPAGARHAGEPPCLARAPAAREPRPLRARPCSTTVRPPFDHRLTAARRPGGPQVRYKMEATGGERALVWIDAVLSTTSVLIYIVMTYR